MKKIIFLLLILCNIGSFHNCFSSEELFESMHKAPLVLKLIAGTLLVCNVKSLVQSKQFFSSHKISSEKMMLVMLATLMYVAGICIEVGEHDNYREKVLWISRLIDAFFQVVFLSHMANCLFNESHVFPSVNQNPEGSCSICFCEFDDPVNPCCIANHVFCNQCVSDWSKNSDQQTCPLCRQNMVRKLPTVISELKRLFSQTTGLQKAGLSSAFLLTLVSSYLFLIDCNSFK